MIDMSPEDTDTINLPELAKARLRGLDIEAARAVERRDLYAQACLDTLRPPGDNSKWILETKNGTYHRVKEAEKVPDKVAG